MTVHTNYPPFSLGVNGSCTPQTLGHTMAVPACSPASVRPLRAALRALNFLTPSAALSCRRFTPTPGGGSSSPFPEKQVLALWRALLCAPRVLS